MVSSLVPTLALMLVASGCSWPEYGYDAEGRGCNSSMLVCLNMDASPTEAGFIATQVGAARFEVFPDEYRDNRTLRFETPGTEASPGPAAKLSWSPTSPILAGRLMFDFRLAEIGPYTQVSIAELDFGERALRFFLRSIPDGQSLSVQYTQRDRASLVWELSIPDQAFFQETRFLELVYSVEPGTRMAAAYIEGAPVAQDFVLDEDWVPSGPSLHFGAFDHIVPTSQATFELDNVGFDAPPR